MRCPFLLRLKTSRTKGSHLQTCNETQASPATIFLRDSVSSGSQETSLRPFSEQEMTGETQRGYDRETHRVARHVHPTLSMALNLRRSLPVLSVASNRASAHS